MNTWVIVKEREKQRSRKGVIHLYLFYDWNLGSSLVLANLIDGYSSLEPQNSPISLLMLGVYDSSQPWAFSNRPNALQTAL